MKKIRSKYSNPDFRFARFKLGQIDFGIDIRSVKEMLRYSNITAIPEAPDFIEGTVELRGMSVPVIDLRRRFALETASDRPEQIMLVVINDSGAKSVAGTEPGGGGIITGLLIDEICDVAMGCKEAMIKTKSKQKRSWDGCVEAVVETGSGSVFVIDLKRLLSSSEVEALKSPLFQTPG
ncbi:MAG: chemotaxis protein CheW [Proteobacteria bacterium]|nr:chemotaxis protein CheW [Pseudomonadota bacterium]